MLTWGTQSTHMVTLSAPMGTLSTHMGCSECSRGYSGYSHEMLTLQHDLAAMRIAELKQLCLAHGLKRTGVKVF